MGIGQGKHVIIVGAGLAGSLMACYLARFGYRVSLYERRPDPRRTGAVGGRSINLALSVRGIKGLEGAGLHRRVLEDAIPMRGRMIHPPSAGGPLHFQAYSRNKANAINSVSRAGLNLTLLTAALELPGVEMHFDHRCIDVDIDAPVAHFVVEGDDRPVSVKADLIIGADGAFSPVRGRLQKNDRFEYSQSYLEQGYKELSIPPAAQIPGFTGKDHDGFALEPNALHIWPRGGAMMIALPNRDRSFTCTLFWPFTGPHSFENLRTAEQIERFFGEHYPDAVPLMPTLTRDFLANPASSLVTVRCRPWYHRDKVVVLGDAAHAIVPFFGQGMNAAFEDCQVLAECLDRHRGDVARALCEFDGLRKRNADAIADMALANFVEMRDKVKSRAFRARKRAEHALQAILPSAFTPLYDLVSFSTIPYADAMRRGQVQDRRLRMLGYGTMLLLGGVAGLLALALL